VSDPSTPKTLDPARVRAVVRAADGDLEVVARALKVSTREVLKALVEPDRSPAPAPALDRPAWTDDDDGDRRR